MRGLNAMDVSEFELRQYLSDWVNISASVTGKYAQFTVNTCLDISGILTATKEMLGILLKVQEVSGEKICQGKVAKSVNCSLNVLICTGI